MNVGTIVEYIDQKETICAVVLDTKNQRIRVLTESNREITIPVKRIFHQNSEPIDISVSRDTILQTLKETVNRRKAMMEEVNVEELWEVLHTEMEWVDAKTMAELCFVENLTADHISAVIRALFYNRVYFKFDFDRFLPNTITQVDHLKNQIAEAERKERLIKEGGEWLKQVWKQKKDPIISPFENMVEMIRSAYLYGKEYSEYALVNKIVDYAGINLEQDGFKLFLKLKVWDENENIDLLRYDIPIDFSDQIHENIMKQSQQSKTKEYNTSRKDLTDLPIITIDGQSTLDHDDAISIEKRDNGYYLGVHIADVASMIEKDSPLDKEALNRGTSIYMPDQKIPMLPNSLAENLLSLKENEVRPAISIMANISENAEVSGFEIFPSLIRVSRQLTYHDANLMIDNDPEIQAMYQLASSFHRKRTNSGALHITLPEIQIRVENANDIIINRINKHNPSRFLIAEIMILANWLKARFLKEHGVPSIFRSQPEPKNRLFENDEEGSLFQNWMQRKLLSRFVLNTKPESHSGLGLECYVTATSPIRKYFDLVSQRQIRAILGLEKPYQSDEIKKIIQVLHETMIQASRIQFSRNRYWILKYLEKRIGQKEEAIVLDKRWSNYCILLTEYMLECLLPISNTSELHPQDKILVKLQRISARNNTLSVGM